MMWSERIVKFETHKKSNSKNNYGSKSVPSDQFSFDSYNLIIFKLLTSLLYLNYLKPWDNLGSLTSRNFNQS